MRYLLILAVGIYLGWIANNYVSSSWTSMEDLSLRKSLVDLATSKFQGIRDTTSTLIEQRKIGVYKKFPPDSSEFSDYEVENYQFYVEPIAEEEFAEDKEYTAFESAPDSSGYETQDFYINEAGFISEENQNQVTRIKQGFKNFIRRTKDDYDKCGILLCKD